MRSAGAFIIASLTIFAAWHGYAALVIKSSVVFPSPLEVYAALLADIDGILSGVGLTMLEALVGFVVAAVLGYAMALLFYIIPAVRHGLYPYAIILKATPLIAFAPILVLWLGDGFSAKAVMAAVVAFFPVLVASYVGLKRYDSEALVFFQTLGANPRFILKRIIVPGSIPYLFSGLRIGSTLSVVGAVIAEFTGATAGAGYLIKTYSYYLNTDSVFATIIALGLASVLFFFAVSIVERVVVFWEKVE
jgi:NitT/TauT family transport system permease protein